MPFHGWLPDAHTAAPGPVSALFSGLMVNLGIVAIARLTLQVYAGHGRPVLGLLTVLGLVSAVGGALLALAQDDLKRLLAYDTVSQMGVLAVGVGTASPVGLAGTTYHLLSHALFKALLFLCAGAIVHATGLTKLSEMGGLARRRPVVAAAFVVAGLAISGVPPMNGYVSLGLVHDALRSTHPVVFATTLLAQIITIAALARAAYLAFFRRRAEEYGDLERLHPGMLTAFGTLAAGCVGFGLVPGFMLRHVAAPAAASLADGATYSRAVLAGGARLAVPRIPFDYLAPAELLTVAGTVLAGLALAWWYLGHSEPRVVRGLRALHNGSVNDYAAYATLGAVVTVTTVLVG